MSGTEYVVVASQLNRTDDDNNVIDPLTRGDTFKASDVSEKELKRWLSLKPAVIADKAELDKAQKAQQEALDENARLREELAAAQAELAAVRAANPTLGTLEGGGESGAPVEEPSGNASRHEWAAYARAVDPDNAAWIGDEENVTRNDLRDKYKGSSGS